MALATKTWNVGDILTAADLNSYVRDNILQLAPFSDTLLGADTASFDITSITTGTMLDIALYLRTTQAAVTSSAIIRFNNDSAANYDRQRLKGAGATASAAESLATASPDWSVPGASATANKFAATRISIPHFAGSVDHKTADVLNAHVEGTTTGTIFAEKQTIAWRSSSAITRVTILPVSGNFKSGSRCTIWIR